MIPPPLLARVIQVVDISQPNELVKARTLSLSALEDLGEDDETMAALPCAGWEADSVQSVAITTVSGYPNSVVIAAAPSSDTGGNGMLVFYDAKTFEFLTCAETGVKPEGISSTSGYVACVNEGSPEDDGSADYEGSITICSISGAGPTVACGTKTFGSSNFKAGMYTDAATFRAAGVRLYGPSGDDPSLDLEPEGCAFTSDGKYLFVAMQDNNAYAIWDVAAGEWLMLGSFGSIEMSLDPSDKDDKIAIASSFGADSIKVYGLPMPDGAISFSVDGDDTYYFITPNEGDTRDGEDMLKMADDFEGEELRMGKYTCSCSDCCDDEILGRLLTTPYLPSDYAENCAGGQLSNASQLQAGLGSGPGSVTYGSTVGTSTTGAPGGTYSIGTRSFTIWSWDGSASAITKVWDSGSKMEEVTSTMVANGLCDGCTDAANVDACESTCPFNSDNRFPPSMDDRSDAKGPEPECATTGTMPDGTLLAFVGLERTGGIITYDISTPASPVYQDFLNVVNWGTSAEDLATYGDSSYSLNDGPEGLAFISADDSPIGVPLLAAVTPIAGRLTMYVVESGAARTDDGSCSTTATCPYIKAALGGEGSAYVDICDIAATPADFGCAGKKASDDDPTMYIIIIAVVGLMVLVSCATVFVMYTREKAGSPIWKPLADPDAASPAEVQMSEAGK